MKLIFIINNTRIIGGGEYAQFKFAQMLAQRNHEVVIFAGDKNFLTEELSKTPNLSIYYKRSIPILVKKVGFGQINKLWSKIYETVVITKYFKENRSDWIIGYLRESAIQAARLGKRHNIKTAQFVFENPKWMREALMEDEWNEEISHKNFIRSWEKTKKAYEQSNILIPNSLLSGKKMSEWVATKNITKPVFPGIDFMTLKRKKNKYDIIYIGRLNKLKNVDELLDSIKETNISVVIIGGGEEKSKLELLAKKNGLNVRFAGSVTDTEKFQLLTQSKLLVFPSSFEGFGMPPMEGMLAGCHVLCSDLPIFKEIYGSQVTYFRLHDKEDMRKKILMLLKKNEPRELSKISDKYSWMKSAITIENILGKYS